MRILLTTDAVGGVWQYSLDLAAGLRAQGIEPVLAVLGPSPTPAQLQEAGALAVIDTGLPLDWTADTPDSLSAAARALRLLADGVASVHLHAPALVGEGRWPAPVVAVAHSCVATWWRAVRGGPLPDDFRWRSAATAAGLQAADAVLAPSASHALAVQAVYGALPVHVVHNGRVPPDLPEMPRERAVLTAGRLWDDGKAMRTLDHAAAELEAPVRAAGPVAGPNGVRVAFTQLRLLGTLDADGMARAYAQAAVFASAARYEPFGLSVLEAAQSGLRLVLADISSFRELWDGAAHFVSAEADWAAALQQALDGDGDGGARARAARYTVDAMVAGTLDVHRAAGAAL